MAQTARQMHLGVYVMGTGHHVAGWRLPEAQAGARLMFKRKGPPHAAYGSDAPRQLTRAKWWLATAVVLFASFFAFIVSRLS